MAVEQFQVAIIGGGLCGLALAIALTKHSIPFHVYEARASFTEIGAGINIGPNLLKAFQAIDPSLADAVLAICSRNPAPKADVWMQLRYGAATTTHDDYDLMSELNAPPTGNMTTHRNDLLRLLASELPENRASFQKKLKDLQQDESGVTMTFEDGSSAVAHMVVACDGIHSSVRRVILGGDNPASVPQFVGDGVYRAMIPVAEMQAILGDQTGRLSQVLLGPNGYIIMYPVTGGENMNVGLWTQAGPSWTSKEWVKPHQRAEMLRDFRDWGETAHSIMKLIPDPSFWATHSHSIQPSNFSKGRVCLIGDSAHSMPPHQGAGAGQAMEDAYLFAEVLSELLVTEPTSPSIQSALQAFETVRKPRFQRVLETSIEAMKFWLGFYNRNESEEHTERFKKAAEDRFAWIWDHDIVADAQVARQECRRMLAIPASG